MLYFVLRTFRDCASFVCLQYISLPASEIVIVDRGIKTLIDASAKYQWQYIVHVQCRKNYTRRSTIAAVQTQHEEDQASKS